ncbi:hypothetical protein SDC9_13872 [bioreactor metagenome]|uniref:CdaA regulatory protein CdaR n=1 Tax=bioreactor metagenome TaxID=1076179 RepID=A0A644TNI3_9ZZZZ|nr:CdaR family protein [Negativicutes bacterium]
MDRLPKKNLTAKIIAVIFAAILWAFVMNEQNPPIEVSYQVPLEVRNLSSNMIVNDTPDAVKIRVRGSRSVVAGLSANEIKAYIDMRGVPEGVNTAKVNISSPSNLEIIEVMPDTISLQLDAIISRPVQMEISPIGTPQAGVKVAKTTANVSSVRVEGPRAQLEIVDKVVAYVDISGKTADFTIDAPLVVLNPAGKELKGVTLSPRHASITVNLTGINKKVVDVKTILVSDVPKNAVLRRIKTTPDKVEITGEAALIDNTEVVFTEPISLSNIDQSGEVEVNLQLREGVKAATSKVVVRIDIDKKP